METNKPWLPASRPARLSASSSRKWRWAFVVRFCTRLHASWKYICKDFKTLNSIYKRLLLINYTNQFLVTSARLHWYPITRASALSARASGCIASGTLATRAQLTFRFCDAWEVSLLVPPWCFRPERERTPERGREKGLGAGYQAFLSKEIEQGILSSSNMRLKGWKKTVTSRNPHWISRNRSCWCLRSLNVQTFWIAWCSRVWQWSLNDFLFLAHWTWRMDLFHTFLWKEKIIAI